MMKCKIIVKYLYADIDNQRSKKIAINNIITKLNCYRIEIKNFVNNLYIFYWLYENI
jgi:hypothetical protein